VDHTDALAWLQKLYVVKLTDDQFKFFLEKFKDISPDVFSAATKEAAASERAFPTVAVLRNYVDLEQDRRWRELKKTENRFPLSEPNAKTEHAQESFGLLYRTVIEKKLTGPMSEEMWRMHEKFPDAGWDEAARAQEAREKSAETD
jgi:hypothetical protein